MKKLLVILIGAVCITSCLKGSYQSNYTAVCSFEFNNIFKDSLYSKSYFAEGGFVFNSFRNKSEQFLGGFMISMKCDTIYKSGHISRSPYCVADTTAIGKCFLVFKQSEKETMPEHDIIFLSTEAGIAMPQNCYVNNTNDVANIVMFGRDAVPAFKEGDYLKLTITATLGGKVKDKKVEVNLAEYKGVLKVLKDWKLVNLTSLGDFDFLDFELTSNRNDIPMLFCMDHFVAKVDISQ